MRTLILVLLAACTPASAASVSQASLVAGCTDVDAHGAIPGDGLDDAPAIQDAIDACAAAGGGTVTVPAGVYTLARHGGWAYFTLVLADGVHLRGESRSGSILQLAPNSVASLTLIHTVGAVDAALTDLTLDGNRAAQSPSEHRHGLTSNGSTRLRIERVTAQNFTGDGLYLYNGTTDVTVRDVRSSDNDRNGITIAPSVPGVQVRGVSISGSQFVRNNAQQIDSEPGGEARIEDVRISDCLVDAEGVSSEYVLTISGTGTAYKGNGWHVSNSRINGPINIVWFDDVTLTGNDIQNPTTKAAVHVYRSTARVTITGNRIALTHPTLTSAAVVRIIATSSTSQPDDVVVSGNVISAVFPTNMGVAVSGARRVVVTGNTVSGGSAYYYPGIRVRGTVPTVASVIVTGNNVRGFWKGFDVHDAHNVQTVVVTGNTFNDLPLVWP